MPGIWICPFDARISLMIAFVSTGLMQIPLKSTGTLLLAGLGGSSEVQAAPVAGSGRVITLENSGDGSNITASYLTSSLTDTPVLTYRKSLKKRHFRIYIKFFSSGKNMAVYMEPMD